MSEILVQVRERSIEAVHNADIKALYELLEKYHGELTVEIEHGLYGNILELALELLTNALETHSKLSLENESDFYTLRALYEYSISHYSSKKYFDAKALFEVLEGISKEEEFIRAMKIHAAAAALSIDIDSFIDKYCIVDERSDDFYIKKFTQEAQKMLDKAQRKAKKDASLQKGSK